MGAVIASPKPRFRGRIHQVAFFVSLPAGVVLILLANGPAAIAVAGWTAVRPPLGDLRADRGELHAGRGARARRALGGRAPVRDLGGSGGRGDLEDGSPRWVLRGERRALHRARLAGHRGLAAA